MTVFDTQQLSFHSIIYLFFFFYGKIAHQGYVQYLYPKQSEVVWTENAITAQTAF